MNHSANRPAFHLYVTQLALALSCLLMLSTNVMGFQADEQDTPKTEQKESDDKVDDEAEDKEEEQEDKEPEFLKIGGEAPALDLEYWPTDNNGLLPPVKRFESGKTYVLNFFQPENEFSVGSLKSMVDLQSKYAGEPVQIVCISVSSRDEADEFLDSEVKGDNQDKETYIDLLNPVSTAVDADQKATIAYIAKSGIVRASTFIIGPTGKLEWLGQSADIKKPLAQIVKGKWDRKAFAKTIETEQTQLARRLKQQKQFNEWMADNAPKQRIDMEQILQLLADGAEDPDNKDFRIRIQATRMGIMLGALKAGADFDNLEEDLPQVMRDVTKLSQDDTDSNLNDSAWLVYEMYEAGTVEKDSELMEVAHEMADKALKYRPESGAVNDTVAHFVYLLDDDIDRAIKLQELAIKNSGDTQEDELKDFLKFLKKEKATGKKKSLQKNNSGGEESDF